MSFSYINEDTINTLLKCTICSKPFFDPVITRNGDRFCRLCITAKYQNDHSSDYQRQSSFIDDLVSITEPILLVMLDDLLVKCLDCEQLNIRRIDFPKHLINQCSKRLVLCKASDLKCPWNGSYDQYNEHINQCTFELLRPILSETIKYQKELEECKLYCHKQQYENEELKKQILLYENRIEKLQKGFKAFLEISSQQRIRYEKFQNDIQDIRNEFMQQNNRYLQIENDIQQIKEQYYQINTLFNQFQQTKINLPTDNNQYEKEFQQIEQRFNQHELDMKKFQEIFLNSEKQIKQLQKEELHRKNELIRLRQISDQHQVQIHLLARKKSIIPNSTTPKTSPIIQFIETFKPNSEINLDEKRFDKYDMEIICKTAVVIKQCQKLRLENTDISAKDVTILADTLYGNTTLAELYLSNNRISDMGVHALAQVLSVNNWTLSWLELHSNNITDEGAEYLAEMLKTNKTLSLLGLSFNQISDKGVRYLATAITCYNETLQWLHLASNKLITDASVDNLVEMLTHNHSLQALWLNDCSLSENAKTKLKQVVQSNTNFILEI